ncbi:hypothetical protein ACHAXR_008526 [Thalassiosira sp. AJA248-18]
MPNNNGNNNNNSAGNTEAIQIRLDREREGRCADCGAQTHEVQFDPSGSGRSIKAPLSVPGEVHRGRCLFCHPLPAKSSSSRSRKKRSSTSPSKHSHQQFQYPGPDDGSAYSQQHSFQRSSSVPQGQQLGYVEENQLEQHFNNNQQPPLRGQLQGYQQESSTSVCTASSQQSSRSIYSHQSAPIWGGGQQQQQQQPFQQQVAATNSNGFNVSTDLLAENYQQQQYLQQQIQQQQQQIQQAQQQLQQQQHQHPDDGSVYSHTSHQSHHSIYSHASNHSQASYNSYNQQQLQLPSPQLNPQNIDTQFHRAVSATSSVSPPINANEGAAAEVIFRQMQEETLDFEKCLQAMRRFPSHAPIQEKGCGLLWAQTSNNAEIIRALASNNNSNSNNDAMRNHPHIPNLQHAGCEALRNLCNILPLNRQLILQTGGVPLLVEMMQLHVENPEIQRSGCMALASVAEGGMECKIAVAECGGILSVMKAVEIHPENDVLLRAAYQALRMLGYNPGGKS